MSTAAMDPVGLELRGALDRWLDRAGQPGVARLSRRPSRYATSAEVVNIHVTLEDGARLRLVYKRTDSHGLQPAARGVKPDFLTDPGREIWMYREVLEGDEAYGAPVLYGAGAEAGGVHWLLLERVDGVELFQVGDRRVWCLVAAWLARMHQHSAARVASLANGAVLPWSDPAFHLRWAERAQANLEDQPLQNSAAVRLRPLWRQYNVVAQRISELRPTLVHGDFNPSNIMVIRADGAVRVRAIDWEMAGIGPGLIDLASLVSGGWSDAERDAMVQAYRHALDQEQPGALSADEFGVALDCCRLAIAVQWLGWSAKWLPPPQHNHPWADEAIRLADRLGILNGRPAHQALT